MLEDQWYTEKTVPSNFSPSETFVQNLFSAYTRSRYDWHTTINRCVAFPFYKRYNGAFELLDFSFVESSADTDVNHNYNL